jgi:hypothetical protein
VKYYYWMHGFIDLSKTKVVNVWSNSLKKWCCMVSHNMTLAPVVHSVVILAIVSFKRTRAWSMGADEPFDTSTLSKQLSLSMAVNPQCQQFRPHPLNLGCNPHCWTHHHPIVSIPS